MRCGIRVVLVMNRKGGSGKSTLCRALASAAAARGETVTIFDTDASKSCLNWMQAGQDSGNWSPLVEVIHSLDAHRVVEAIDQVYEQPDQDHLILIDTFGGGSVAQDVLAVAAHRIVCPMMLSRGDLSEAVETANWYLSLRGRVDKPAALPGFLSASVACRSGFRKPNAPWQKPCSARSPPARPTCRTAAPTSGWTRKGFWAPSQSRRRTGGWQPTCWQP